MSDEREIQDVATLVMGTSPKGDTYNNAGHGMPLLNGPTEFGPVHPDCSLFTTAPIRRGEAGDLLFCVRGSTTGRMNWADRAYALGRGVAGIRAETPVETRFVRYCLELRLPGLLKRAGGGTFPNLKRDDIASFSIPWLESRRQIAAVIAAYDEMIENNLRWIEILEEMAQAIYREWFVNFHHPGYEADELVDSSLGPIPDGWVLTPLQHCARKLVDGDWIETKDQGGTDFRLLQVSNIGIGRFRETGNYRYIAKSTFERLRCTEIKVGDILISRMPDPVGRAWLVDFLAEPAVTAVDVAILSPRSHAIGVFLDQYLNSPATRSQVAAMATGTTRLRVTRRVLAQMELAIPPDSLLEPFARVLQPNLDLRSNLARQNANLRVTRDLLLPKLISGEIDVSDLDIDTSWLAA